VCRRAIQILDRDLEFVVGDVLLKVSPMKRIVCFDIKGKLRPRYIGPILLQLELVP
jgi:hypothetical protein